MKETTIQEMSQKKKALTGDAVESPVIRQNIFEIYPKKNAHLTGNLTQIRKPTQTLTTQQP